MKTVERLRQDVAYLRTRAHGDEDALERAEELLAAEERRIARARRSRLSKLELARLESCADRRLIDAAIDELHELTLSPHDRSVLEGVGARLDGYERDLVERLLEMTGPRRTP